MPDLDVDLDVLAQAFEGLSIDLDVLAQAYQGFSLDLDVVMSTAALTVDLDVLMQAWSNLSLDLDAKMRTTSAEEQQAISDGVVSIGGSNPGAPEFTFESTIVWSGEEKDLSQVYGGPVSLTISRKINEPATLNLSLQDDACEFDPAHPSSGWANWLRPTPYPDATSGEYAKKVVARCSLGGVDHLLFVGPILGRGQSGSQAMQDGWRHVLRCVDMAHKLLPGAKNIQSMSSSYGSVITNLTVLNALLDAAKMERDLSGLTRMPTTDWHQQNRSYLDGIKRMLESCGGDWRVVGETFQAFDPRIKPTPDWTYSLATGAVEEVSHDESAVEIYNAVTVVRHRGMAQELGRGRATSLGQHTISFSAPAVAAGIGAITEIGGAVSDIYLTDQGGNIISVLNQRGPQPPITGSWPATGCTFTFGQGAGQPLETGEYAELVMIGRTADNPILFGSDFDEVGSRTYRDEESITAYGEFPLEVVDDLLPNESWMRNRATRIIERSKGLALQRSWKVPLNPGLYPGQTVRLVYPETSETVDLYATAVDLTISPNPGDLKTVFTGVQYR